MERRQFLALAAAAAVAPHLAGSSRAAKAVGEIVDVHVHLESGPGSAAGAPAMVAAAAKGVELMDEFGVTRSVVMGTPAPDFIRNADRLVSVATSSHGERYAWMGGGHSLNALIQTAIDDGEVSTSLRRRFRYEAAAVKTRGAVGFGEFAIEHLAFTSGHPYVHASPTHPLFLLLADMAAGWGMPIDLHMEALEDDMTTPSRFASPPNPETLDANIALFEELLGHNRDARICWAHVGWDNTGQMSVDLLRRLLDSHSNLYMQIKFDDLSLDSSKPVDANGALREEWRTMIEDFPDRFMLGTDVFFGNESITRDRWPDQLDFLDLLPDSVAQRVASENAKAVYNL